MIVLYLLTKQTVFVRHQCNVYVMQIRNKNAKIYTVQIHFHQNWFLIKVLYTFYDFFYEKIVVVLDLTGMNRY